MTATKLHVGCGSAVLPGWVNMDIEPLPGVDMVHDVRMGLPFDSAELIFAEHFIEHLDFADGLAFLVECRRVLTDTGVLRLSTPNLDWVWTHQYHYGAWQADAEAVRDCFWMNKAFRGWGHRFLYNRQTLCETLREAGFDRVEVASYGESQYPALRHLERHEKYVETPETPHVIVVDASGRTRSISTTLTGPRAEFEEAVSRG